MATEAGADRERAAARRTKIQTATRPERSPSCAVSIRCASDPGMYIGSTGPRGLHHLVYEVVDNSVDEALAGYCDRDRGHPASRQRVTVADNGRGIPVDEHPEEKRPAAEVVLTTLHAGGKFGRGQRLQGLRRPARGRRLGRQRALRAPAPGGAPRRLQVDPGLRARRAKGRPEARRQGQGQRDDDHLPRRRRGLRDARVRLLDPRRADARDRLPDPRPARSSWSTSAAPASATPSSTRAGSSTSSST